MFFASPEHRGLLDDDRVDSTPRIVAVLPSERVVQRGNDVPERPLNVHRVQLLAPEVAGVVGQDDDGSIFVDDLVRTVVDGVLVLTPPVQNIRVDRGERVADLVNGRGFGVLRVVVLFDALLNVGVRKVVSDIFAAVSDDFLVVLVLVIAIVVVLETVASERERDLVLFVAAFLDDDGRGVAVDLDRAAGVFGLVVADDLVGLQVNVETVLVSLGDASVDVQPVVAVFAPAVDVHLIGAVLRPGAVTERFERERVGVGEFVVGHCLSPVAYVQHTHLSLVVYMQQ